MVPIPQKERQLVQELQAGQSSAFTTLYDAYAPTLFGALVRLVNDQSRAEDLLQDTFIKVWINIHRYDADQGRLFTWLLTIARNVAFDEIRFCKARNKAMAYTHHRIRQDTNTQATEAIDYQPLFEWVAPKYRPILDLTFQGYTQEEIANQCGLPLGTVKTRHRAVIQKLKLILRQDIDHYAGQ